MSSLFGGDEIAKAQKQQQMAYKSSMKSAEKTADKWGTKGLGYIDTALSNVANSAAKPIDFATPSYGIHLDSGGGLLNRTGETQGVMDALLSGGALDEATYGDLLSQIQPGFGRLSQATLNDIENQSRAAVGNLREQLARRRVLGASFANDQLAGLKATYDQLRQKALAENWVQEMEMTKQLISQRTEARNQTLAQAMNQIQFEGDVGQKLTSLVLANNNDMAKLQADLANTAAQLAASLGGAQIGAVSQLGSTNQSAITSLGQSAAEAAAGPMNLLSSVLGTAAGAATSHYLGK